VQISDISSSVASKKIEEVITPKYTKQTEDIINQLKAEKPKNTVAKPSISFGLTSKEKYQDLLSVTKRLVMPAQYRALKDMAKYIDISLNFLKSRKTTAGI